MHNSSWNSLPELAGLSRQERDRVLAVCSWQSLKHWDLWAMIAVAPFLVFTASRLLITSGIHSPLIGLTAFLALPVQWAATWMRTRHVRKHIRDWLSQRESRGLPSAGSTTV